MTKAPGQHPKSDVHRRKLESDPARPRYLKTEAGVGYRLVDE